MGNLTPEQLLLKEFHFKITEDDEDVRQGTAEVILVGRSALLSEIESVLQSAAPEDSTTSVSMVLNGSGGVGKTHTITWILNQINSKQLKIRGREIKAYSIDAPDMGAKNATFSLIYQAIIKKMGKEFLIAVIHKWWDKKETELGLNNPQENAQQKIARITKEIENRDFASMILYRKGIALGSVADDLWWSWIAGLPVTKVNLEKEDMTVSANVPNSNSDTAIEVMQELFLKIIPTATERKYFFLICMDECENMSAVPPDNAAVRKGVREMLDTNISQHLGFIFACNTGEEGELDFEILGLEPIKTRITAPNFKKLEVWEADGAKKFIKDILKSKRVDDYDEKFQSLVQKGVVTEDMKDLYPFRDTQLDSIFSYMDRQDMTLIPRDILNMLDTITSDAKQHQFNSDEEMKLIDISESSPYIENQPDEGENEDPS